ncbi:hypothetical protein D3C81_1206340 [compost metagenome]
MLVGGMIDHQIHNELHPPVMKALKQFLPVLDRTKVIHDRLVVTDIITIVIIRRLIDRREPYYIDPQSLQIIKL